MRAFALHDHIVSRRIKKLVGQIDIIHAWPLGSLRTLKVAARLGIPTVLERPNAHTRYFYEVAQKECERLGIELPPCHEHAYNPEVLKIEEQEYALASRLLCPSNFVARTFLENGFAQDKLARHRYGFNEKVFFANRELPQRGGPGLAVLFVGGAVPIKGLHFALEAWLQSSACKNGQFRIAGQFVSAYAEFLSPLLSHPSIRVLGHRTDVSELMRKSDVLVLPSLEEGSALVTYEARGSGCVLLVSDAAGAVCRHMENALVHHAGDVEALTHDFSVLNDDRALLERLRTASLSTLHEITWTAAGERLLSVYRETIDAHSNRKLRQTRLGVQESV
jgi:glycosyltransferase involved in cell wall biosynthesis